MADSERVLRRSSLARRGRHFARPVEASRSVHGVLGSHSDRCPTFHSRFLNATPFQSQGNEFSIETRLICLFMEIFGEIQELGKK